MAWNLNKSERSQWRILTTELQAARERAENAVEKYNDEVIKAFGELEAEMVKFNEALESARSFAEDVHSERDGEFGDKSESWQDGERGQEVAGFITAWEEASQVEAFNVTEPDLLEVDLSDTVGPLMDAPEEVNS